MTGPQHFKEAERLLAGHVHHTTAKQWDVGPTAGELAAAQVHATLALAAATALKTPSRSRWGKAAGRQGQAS